MSQDHTETTVTNGASVKTGNLAIVDTEDVPRGSVKRAGKFLRVTIGTYAFIQKQPAQLHGSPGAWGSVSLWGSWRPSLSLDAV